MGVSSQEARRLAFRAPATLQEHVNISQVPTSTRPATQRKMTLSKTAARVLALHHKKLTLTWIRVRKILAKRQHKAMLESLRLLSSLPQHKITLREFLELAGERQLEDTLGLVGEYSL